jgi:FHS family glucose/mannose:H+ symporter-like MFS transporter
MNVAVTGRWRSRKLYQSETEMGVSWNDIVELYLYVPVRVRIVRQQHKNRIVYPMVTNTKALTVSAYISMLFLGVSTAVIGAAARNIGLTPFQIGLFITIQNVGFMIAVAASGALGDDRDKTNLLLVGSLILAMSLFTFFLTGLLWLNLLIMLLIGVGVGTYEGVTDPLLLDLHEKRQSLHININHFFVTLGAIAITVYLIFLEMNWRRSLVQSAIIVLFLALFFALAKINRRKEGHSGESYWQRLRILTKDRLVVALFLATVVVVGVEGGTIGILTTYLIEGRDYSDTTSKIGLIVFLVGIATGRIIFGLISHRSQTTQFILWLFASATVIFGVLYFVDAGQWQYILIFLAGLSISAILPLMIALAGQLYPDISGTVIGAIKVGIPIGGITIPFLMSLLAQGTSLQIAMVVFPLSLLLAFWILLI